MMLYTSQQVYCSVSNASDTNDEPHNSASSLCVTFQHVRMQADRLPATCDLQVDGTYVITLIRRVFDNDMCDICESLYTSGHQFAALSSMQHEVQQCLIRSLQLLTNVHSRAKRKIMGITGFCIPHSYVLKNGHKLKLGKFLQSKKQMQLKISQQRSDQVSVNFIVLQCQMQHNDILPT